MPSLSDLRSQPAPDERVWDTVTVTLTTGQHLSDEWNRLHNERLDLLAQMGKRSDDDDEPDGPPRKTAQGVPPRIAEIDAEQAALNDRMVEHQGDLTIRSRPTGEWLRWCGEHPAREGNEIDARLTGGQCNAEDLLGDLGAYAYSWDGGDGAEEFAPGDWDRIRLVPGDLQMLVRKVVELHGSRFERAPKSPKPSGGSESGETA